MAGVQTNSLVVRLCAPRSVLARANRIRILAKRIIMDLRRFVVWCASRSARSCGWCLADALELVINFDDDKYV